MQAAMARNAVRSLFNNMFCDRWCPMEQIQSSFKQVA
jgi:hypothetical protein